MSDNAGDTTLVVKDEHGKAHMIHSDKFGIAALLDVLQKAGPDAEAAARYRWFREQPMERKVWIAEMSDDGHMLDHHIDKGMCGL